MKCSCRCLLSAILLSAAGFVVAQDADSKPKANAASPANLFEKLDVNSDGKLVKDEIADEQRRSFERLLRLGDKNDDGELTRDEFKAATADQPTPEIRSGFGQAGQSGRRQNVNPEDAFKRMDRNRDGKLSRDELPEFLRERFSRLMDEAGKDSVTLEDFVKLRQRMEGTGGGRPGMNGRPSGSPEENFKRLDSNGDGKLLLSEIPEAARPFLGRLFERLGKGPDDAVTQDEFVEAARQFARQAGQQRPDGQRRPDSEPQDGRPGDRRPDGDQPPRDGRPMQDGQRRGPRFLGLLDSNRDGRLSRDEVAQMAKRFGELDVNGDGQLDPRELFGAPPQGQNQRRPDQRPQNRRPESDERGDRPRRPESDSPQTDKSESRRDSSDGNSRRGGLNIDTIFSRLDRNKDKAIDRNEAIGRLKENFDRVDANKDGKVTQQELRDARSRTR